MSSPSTTRRSHPRVHQLGRALPATEPVGGTAKRLSAMLGIGLPVPPGFAITADTRPLRGASDAVPAALAERVRAAVAELEARTGRRLGAARDPLRLAVRADPLTRDEPRTTTTLNVSDFERLLAAIGRVGARHAVVVQAMVAGTRDAASGSGLVFTRDPATGSPGAYGRFVAVSDGDIWRENPPGEPLYTLRRRCPDAFDALEEALPTLEALFRDMCEIRFTIEAGRLWILQARPGRRHAAAAVRIAVEMVDEGLIAIPRALERVPLPAVARLSMPVLAARQPLTVLARGTPTAPGVAGGRVALERPEPAPGDDGVVLFCAGATPAVPVDDRVRALVTAVADGTRRLVAGPPAVHVRGLRLDLERRVAHLPEGTTVEEGDVVTVDGGAALVVGGTPRFARAPLDTTTARLLDWSNDYDRVPVVTEPDPGDTVIDLGAEAVRDDLAGTVEAALERGATRLALRLPVAGIGWDPRLPSAPWSAVVAEPGMESLARLLAARAALRLEIAPSLRDGRAEPDDTPA